MPWKENIRMGYKNVSFVETDSYVWKLCVLKLESGDFSILRPKKFFQGIVTRETLLEDSGYSILNVHNIIYKTYENLRSKIFKGVKEGEGVIFRGWNV